MSALTKTIPPLRNIEELLTIALRHHDEGRVRNLLTGGDLGKESHEREGENLPALERIALSHTPSPSPARPEQDDAIVKLRLMKEECKNAVEELRDAEAAGQARLDELSAELYAKREAQQKVAIEVDKIHDNLSRGLLYVSGVPLVNGDELDFAAIDNNGEKETTTGTTKGVGTTSRSGSKGRIGNTSQPRNTASIFFEGTSFNDSMLDHLGLFLTKLPASSSPLEPKGDLYRLTTHDYEEMQELRWVPSEVALADANAAHSSDPFSKGVPTRIQIGLNADTIMHKHMSTDDKEAAVREQGGYCKGCLAPLKKSFNPLKGWDSALFCFYSGYYYCENCHKKNTVSPLPALIVREWDFTPKPICEPVKDFLEIHSDSPIICVSAINPQLYSRVPILDAARRLRVEINALHAIGVHCCDYRHSFFECGNAARNANRRRLSSLSSGLFGGGGHSAASGGRSSSSSNGTLIGGDDFSGTVTRTGSVGMGGMESGRSLSLPIGGGAPRRPRLNSGDNGYETYVPLGQRYLAMDSEFWTLNDLIALRNADPSNSFKMPVGWGQAGYSSADSANGGGASSSSAARIRARSLVQPYPGHTHPLDVLVPLCPLIQQLLEMRRQFLRHVVKECVDRCLPRAVHICPACQRSAGHELVFAFDHHNRYYCKGCHSCFHSKCWSILGLLQGSPSGGGAPTCPVCFTIAVNSRQPCGSPKRAATPSSPSSPTSRSEEGQRRRRRGAE